MKVIKKDNPKHGHFRSILIQDGRHFKKFKYANLLVFAFSCVIMNKRVILNYPE